MFFRSEVGKWVITTGNHRAAARNLINLTCLPLKCSDHLDQNPESEVSQRFDVCQKLIIEVPLSTHIFKNGMLRIYLSPIFN